jgi:hypothetical protein
MSTPQDLKQRRYTRRQLLRGALLALGGCAVCGLPFPPTAGTRAQGRPGPVVRPALTPTPTPQDMPFSGELAMQHAAAQMQWVPRHPGTEGARLCGDYILAQLAALGWAAEEQPFVYQETACRNLIGKRGSGPILIIGAHYDTRRYADSDPDPANHDQPVPGANDGASGVAVLLELARVLRPEELGRTIWLTAFDAEDNGGIDGWDWIVGSRYMAENLTETPQGMVLVDMIGDAGLQIYYERHSTTELKEGIWQVAADLGYEAFIPQEKYSIIDDHIPFLQQGIPAVDLIDFDYPYWHTVADTLDKISAASLEAVGRTLEQWLLQGAPGLPQEASSSARFYLPMIEHHVVQQS